MTPFAHSSGLFCASLTHPTSSDTATYSGPNSIACLTTSHHTNRPDAGQRYCPAGPKMAGSTFRLSSTSPTPATPCHPQRRRRVSALTRGRRPRSRHQDSRCRSGQPGRTSRPVPAQAMHPRLWPAARPPARCSNCRPRRAPRPAARASALRVSKTLIVSNPLLEGRPWALLLLAREHQTPGHLHLWSPGSDARHMRAIRRSVSRNSRFGTRPCFVSITQSLRGVATRWSMSPIRRCPPHGAPLHPVQRSARIQSPARPAPRRSRPSACPPGASRASPCTTRPTRSPRQALHCHLEN